MNTTDRQNVQQVPSPTSAVHIGSPAPGTVMTREYVQAIGRIAYIWGWPLVNMGNRIIAFSKLPAPGLIGGMMPAGFNSLCMLTDYVTPDQRAVACPNQDVVYGCGVGQLSQGPLVLQVPDFGDRFWVFALYDQRTDEFSTLGKAYGTRPGFYLIVAPDWKGEVPAGITGVVHSTTDLILTLPRVFMDDTDADRAAIRPLVNQISLYPLAKFTGQLQIVDWKQAPIYPGASGGSKEMRWVVPDTFFDLLPAVLKNVPPLPGEEALYAWINSVLDAAAKDPQLAATLKETAIAVEKEMFDKFMQWQYNGCPAGNGWNSTVNNAMWGTDYLNRLTTGKSNILENKPEETKYFYRDLDSAGEQIYGRHLYSITFAKGQLPPVKGFWSLTLYNEQHFFNRNPLKRYSLGTKNKTLQYNTDGSLTLYAGEKSPGTDKESNWLPAPDGTFSLYIRAYWAEQAILDGSWIPPQVEKMK
ncbi:MAG: DUF1254 domain-containing protein [Chlorobiaceae bacterium]